MYTVIITDERSSACLREYRMLYAPFVRSEKLGFCNWNESGTDLESSLPELYERIRGKKEWRALIVTDPETREDFCGTPLADKRNPFDYLNEKREEDTSLKESSIPLVRLTHMLAGFPALGIKAFEKGFTYPDDETGETVTLKEDDAAEEEIALLAGTYGSAFRTVYIEREYTEEERKSHREAASKYRFREERPQEILLVTSRNKPMDEEAREVRSLWKNSAETESSEFWKRNNYPNYCRFLCFDMSGRGHSSHLKEMAEFWLTILTIAINDIPPSSLQAYRLYRTGVEISQEYLGKALGRYLSRLSQVNASVNERMKQRLPYAYVEEEGPSVRQEVPVLFDQKDGKHLMAGKAEIGLTRDCPQDEARYWKQRMDKTRDGLDKFLKAPKRAVEIASEYAKDKVSNASVERMELSRYQEEDLKEIARNLERETLGNDTAKFIHEKKYREMIEQADREVQKQIEGRMKKKPALLAGIVALALFLLSFYPYLNGVTADAVLEEGPAYILIAFSLLLFAIGSLVILLILRQKLTREIDLFNQAVKEIVEKVHSGIREYEKHISAVCTYMVVQSVLQNATLKGDHESKERKLLTAHKKALTAAIGRVESWCEAFGITPEPAPVFSGAAFFDVERPPEDNEMYRIHPNPMPENLPLNDTGEMLTAPYRFISRMLVEREELYDRVD